jgi:hypothetical protein
MTTAARTRKYGLQHAVVRYFQDNPDRVIVLSELVDKLSPPDGGAGWSRKTINTTVNALVGRHRNIVKVDPGVWRWDSTATDAPAATDAPPAGLHLVAVDVRTVDGLPVMRDAESHALYVVRQVSVR